MEEIMDIETFLWRSSAVIGFVIAIIGWLLRVSIKGLLDQNLANYKSELVAKNGESLELFKSTLGLALKRDEVSIQWLHEKRANVIQDLHSALVDLGDSTQSLLFYTPSAGPEKMREEVKEAFDNVQDTYISYRKARILFTEDTCTKVKAAIDSIGDPVTTFLAFTLVRTGDELADLSLARQQLNSDLGRTLPKAMETLEEEFRVIVGTIEEPATSSIDNP